MGDRSHNPFVLRHPISLGDAIAALFRPRQKRRASACPPIKSSLPHTQSPIAKPRVQEVAVNASSPDPVATSNQVL
ncbi:hypothetical protein [Occallatibacter riparius]|uniref:Uncharacterized protein n=1 Tax=Occallatibacter riparius TaxID=1002689 RepID=A0A9J7BQV3_9BACT|nr:hypothetical protein [Occallatibacter riparius]UWZ85064.1 hypothetical protein MOP44_03760 [Occallatibacter riparius]